MFDLGSMDAWKTVEVGYPTFEEIRNSVPPEYADSKAFRDTDWVIRCVQINVAWATTSVNWLPS